LRASPAFTYEASTNRNRLFFGGMRLFFSSWQGLVGHELAREEGPRLRRAPEEPLEQRLLARVDQQHGRLPDRLEAGGPLRGLDHLLLGLRLGRHRTDVGPHAGALVLVEEVGAGDVVELLRAHLPDAGRDGAAASFR
jgi:hypothetical protein